MSSLLGLNSRTIKMEELRNKIGNGLRNPRTRSYFSMSSLSYTDTSSTKLCLRKIQINVTMQYCQPDSEAANVKPGPWQYKKRIWCSTARQCLPHPLPLLSEAFRGVGSWQSAYFEWSNKAHLGECRGVKTACLSHQLVTGRRIFLRDNIPTGKSAGLGRRSALHRERAVGFGK